MRRLEIENQVEQTDVLAHIDITEVAKEAKLGWLKTILVKAVWPIIKPLLLKRLNPVLVNLIDNILNNL
jgi:hypothetical protein